MLKRFCLISMLIILFTAVVSGETGEAGFKFLNLGVGARAAALGNAFTAVPNDVTALYWNPAGLADIKFSEYNFTHINWLFDLNYEQLYGAINISKSKNRNKVVGAGLRFLSQDEFPVIQSYTETDKVFKSYNFVANIGYAFQFTKTFSIGAGAKFIRESLGDVAANAVSFDVGVLLKMKLLNFAFLPYDNFYIGLVAKEIGPSVKIKSTKFKLPMNLKLGILYIPYKYVQLLMDTGYNVDNGITFNTGVEFLPTWFIQPRLGLQVENMKANFTAGLGVNYSISTYRINADYTIIPSTFLGNRHIFSISFKRLGITDVGVLAKIKKEIQDKKIMVSKIEDDIDKIDTKGSELLDLMISGEADKTVIKEKIIELKEAKEKLMAEKKRLNEKIRDLEQKLPAEAEKVIVKEKTVEKIVVKDRIIEIERKPGSILAFVLDFKNVSANPDYNYLCQAVPDSISVHMAKSKKITLISRSMVESGFEELKIKKEESLQMENVKELGKFLHSNAAVIGSFIISGNVLRLNAQVIDMKTGNIIVAEQSQGELGIDMFDVFDDLSLKIKNAIEQWYGKKK